MYNAKKILAKEGVRKVGKHKKELTLIRDIKKVIDDKFTEEFHSNHPKSNSRCCKNVRPRTLYCS